MKKIIFIIMVLIMVTSGCSQNNIIVDNPPQKEIIPTVINPTQTKTFIQPTKTIKPSVTPTVNQPENIEINLFSPDFLDMAPDMNNPDFSIEEVKAELYFTSGAGGDGGGSCTVDSNQKIPLMGSSINGEILSLCLINIPTNKLISVNVFSPSNEITNSLSFSLDQNLEIKNVSGIKNFEKNIRLLGAYSLYENNSMSYSINYFSGVGDNITSFNEPVIVLAFWFPTIPQLYGDWKIQAQVNENVLEKTITLNKPNYPTIHTIPNLPYNPLKTDLSYKEFNAGDQFIIIGTGYEKSTDYHIGIYRVYENRKVENTRYFGDAANLIFAKNINTNNNGEFYIKFDVSKEELAGRYYIIPEIHNYKSSYNFIFPHFTISNTSNQNKFNSTFECTGSVASRLTVGDFAFVSADPPDANTVRQGPAIKESKVGKIQPLEKIEILNGPKCVDNYIWWEIRSLSTGLSGWTAEGNSTTYWLVPMK